MGKVVETRYGKVEGIEGEGGIAKWLGVPFAKPPLGELRFRRAVEPEPWDGVFECKEFAKIPYQFMIPEGMPPSPFEGSEDCLYANVWAPADAEPGAKLPVFLWIYGGAYHMGSTAEPDYELSPFARDGVIGASIAYRLGPLGFYGMHKMSDRFDSNCAFSDVVAGIKWVHDNIEAFGGDPDNITICGESAGGTMVMCALSSPACKGLFAKAISMSGLAGNVSSRRANKLSTKALLDELGLTEETVDQMADMPFETLFEATNSVCKAMDKKYPGIPLTGPQRGDDLLPDSVWDALKAGSAEGVNCIFGTCHDEGRLFAINGEVPVDWDGVQKMLDNNDLMGMVPVLYAYYPDDEFDAIANMTRDRMFWADTVSAALEQSAKADVYAYRFDFVPAMAGKLGFGATHATDIVPAMDSYNPMSLYNGTPDDVHAKINGYVHGSFVNFCKTGDPNGAIPIEWEKYEPKGRFTMIINEECSVEHDPNGDLYDLWKDVHLYD